MIDVDSVLALQQLVTMTRPGRIPGFELHDVKSGELNVHLTGRAQSATCLLCRKTIASWKGRPPSKRNRRGMVLPPSLEAAMRDHTPVCAEAWMWSVLAKWSTGFATDVERAAIAMWQERNYMADPRRWPGAPRSMARVFDRLPQPPDSEMAQELEVALIAISRLWEP